MSLVIRKLVVVEITDINYYLVVERTIIKIADARIQIDKRGFRLSALATVI